MRKPFSTQARLDCTTIGEVKLNLKCRDEIVPVLAGLRHIYSQGQLRDQILGLVARDVNEHSRSDRGREGLDYWHIIVLAAVRLGCDLDYDKLQDLAEQHRAMRHIMGIGDWQEQIDFSWRRIRDNICLLKPDTIEAISHCILEEAYRLQPDAAKKQRADSFVVETNIHYPTESSLIVDGVRKTIELCVQLSDVYDIVGWRQHDHLLKKVKQTARQIARISARRGANTSSDLGTSMAGFCGVPKRYSGVPPKRARPNEDKLFSIFEPHTQLYRRGKAGQPNQFGRLVLIYEDAAGFISHHHVMSRDAQDRDVAVEQTRKLQQRLDNRVEEISFDRGFHSPGNHDQLAEIVAHVCLPKPGKKQAAEQDESASASFHQARQRHPGGESAIGALQSGNGLVRCRDESEVGFERYCALAVLGRNIHALGKLLIAKEDESAPAAISKRAAA